MNNDAENKLAKFEAFLADTDNQTKEETLAELASHGVRTEEFLKEVQMVVREGYSKRLKQIAEQERAEACSEKPKVFGEIMSLPREAMLLLIQKLKAGEFGPELQQATGARWRNKEADHVTDEELRSWLEDIADMTN
jgi:hypothetical protein